MSSIGGSGFTLLTLDAERKDDADGSSRRRGLQQRQLPSSKPIVFASTMYVLADIGFRVTSADASTGFITATGTGRERVSLGIGGFSRMSDTPTVSVFIDNQPQGRTAVRVVFGESSISSTVRGPAAERMINDQNVYSQFFARLEDDIRSRYSVEYFHEDIPPENRTNSSELSSSHSTNTVLPAIVPDGAQSCLMGVIEIENLSDQPSLAAICEAPA